MWIWWGGACPKRLKTPGLELQSFPVLSLDQNTLTVQIWAMEHSKGWNIPYLGPGEVSAARWEMTERFSWSWTSNTAVNTCQKEVLIASKSLLHKVTCSATCITETIILAVVLKYTMTLYISHFHNFVTNCIHSFFLVTCIDI